MTTIAIERPMNNLTIVTIGEYEFAFSYETVVAFRPPIGGWVKSENVWSQTTGRHLNYLPGDKTKHEDFERALVLATEHFERMPLPAPVGDDEHEPLADGYDTIDAHGYHPAP